jgi:hypothetical protein
MVRFQKTFSAGRTLLSLYRFDSTVPGNRFFKGGAQPVSASHHRLSTAAEPQIQKNQAQA